MARAVTTGALAAAAAAAGTAPVAQVAVGVPDNGRGAVGTGGPVAKGIMRQVGSQPDQPDHPAPAERRRQRRPRGQPQLLELLASDRLVGRQQRGVDDPGGDANDVLVVTSAGNNGDDLDEQDCFVACWEAQHAMPCEVDNVLCVGGLQRNSLDAHSSSNYGDEVTLWAPYITRR